MPILILAAVMFFAMIIATAFALGTEGRREIPVAVRNRHTRF